MTGLGRILPTCYSFVRNGALVGGDALTVHFPGIVMHLHDRQ
jgi:hypothetical protein